MKGKCAGGRWLLKYFSSDYRKRLPLGGVILLSDVLMRRQNAGCHCPLLFPDECAADSLRLAAKREKKPQFLIIAHLLSQPSIHIPLNFQLHEGSKYPYKMNYF